MNFLDKVPQVRPARVRDSDDETDAFVKEVHASNCSRTSNAKLLIGSNVIQGQKSILFELKDRTFVEPFPALWCLII